MQFSSGLDDSFNQVKSNILIMEPLPDVKTAFLFCLERNLIRNMVLYLVLLIKLSPQILMGNLMMVRSLKEKI